MEIKELSFSSPRDPVLEEIARLLSTEWKGFSPEALFAKYAGNPHALAETPQFICVYEGDTLVAANGYVPSRFRLGERRMLGVQDCDSFVRPECRGRGIFSKLVRYAETRFEELGYAFLFGFPNELSTGAYEKLGWNFLPDIEFVGKPMLVAISRQAAHGRASQGWRLERCDAATVTRLEVYPEEEARLELDAEFARWRFAPSRGMYDGYMLSGPDGSAAWAVVAWNKADSVARICALGGTNSTVRRGLLRALTTATPHAPRRIQACAPLARDERRDYLAAGYLGPGVMRVLRRSRERFIYRPLGGAKQHAIPRFRIGYVDFDTV